MVKQILFSIPEGHSDSGESHKPDSLPFCVSFHFWTYFIFSGISVLIRTLCKLVVYTELNAEVQYMLKLACFYQ